MNTSALLARIESGRTDLIVELLGATSSHDTLRDLLREHGSSLQQWAAYFGDVSACRVLQGAGVSLAMLGADRGLNAAAFHGHWQLCEYLIEQGAAATAAQADTGETPLHSALTNDDRLRYDLVVKVLLRAGADPNAATKPDVITGSFMRDARTRGETPLHRAALFGSPATLALLLDAGASREAKDAFGDTPLAWASWARRPVEVLRPLLYGEQRIHPQYRSLRAHLLGEPRGSA
jgi:uncharacterized protein